MPQSCSSRWFAARSAGLVVMIGIYVSVFGTGVSDDRAPATTPAAPAAPARPANSATPAVAAPIRPERTSEDRWLGLHERRITTPIVINLDEQGPAGLNGLGRTRLIMEGPGPAIRLVGTHEGTADPATVKPNVWERQRMPILDGLEIIGNHPEACGIELNGTMQATLTRVNIRGCLHAIHLVGRNRNVLIADSHLYENRGCGVYLDDVNLHQINVTGCHISYNAGGGVVSRKGNVRNLHITGCDIESNMSPETEPTANVLIDCRGSQYGTGEVAITGCTIQHNNPSPDSANVRIIGRSEPTRDQAEVLEGNVTITGNVFSDVQVNVHLQACRGVTLTGNTFWMGFQHNLLVENCSHIIVGSNNLDRNPRYAYGIATSAHNAVEFRNCTDCTISGLHVTNVHSARASVLFDRCRWMNISDATILDGQGTALLLDRCENCRIGGLVVRSLPAQEGATPVAVELIACRDVRLVDDGLVQGEVRTTTAGL